MDPRGFILLMMMMIVVPVFSRSRVQYDENYYKYQQYLFRCKFEGDAKIKVRGTTCGPDWENLPLLQRYEPCFEPCRQEHTAQTSHHIEALRKVRGKCSRAYECFCYCLTPEELRDPGSFIPGRYG